jgi:hypothetical protein
MTASPALTLADPASTGEKSSCACGQPHRSSVLLPWLLQKQSRLPQASAQVELMRMTAARHGRGNSSSKAAGSRREQMPSNRWTRLAGTSLSHCRVQDIAHSYGVRVSSACVSARRPFGRRLRNRGVSPVRWPGACPPSRQEARRFSCLAQATPCGYASPQLAKSGR